MREAELSSYKCASDGFHKWKLVIEIDYQIKRNLSSLPRGRKRNWPNLVKFVCLCSSHCLIVLCCWWYFYIASWLKGFLYVVVVSAHNKWYQGIPGLSWDHLVIRRASVADWWRSCVDLRSALRLFVGSCVDLRKAREVLKESIWGVDLFRNSSRVSWGGKDLIFI